MAKSRTKEWRAAYMSKWRAEHPERWQELRRKSYRKHRKEILAKIRRRKKENADKQRKYYRRHREQCIAQSMLRYAVKNGKIAKPNRCSNCNKKVKPQAHHHRGYSRKFWLDVIWLCSICHGIATAKEHLLAVD